MESRAPPGERPLSRRRFVREESPQSGRRGAPPRLSASRRQSGRTRPCRVIPVRPSGGPRLRISRMNKTQSASGRLFESGRARLTLRPENRRFPRQVEETGEPFPFYRGARRRSQEAPMIRGGRRTILLASLFTLLFASSALGAAATRGPGNGSQLLRTGRLDGHQHRPHDDVRRPRPRVPARRLPARRRCWVPTHVDDAVAIGAKNALTTAYDNAAGRPSNGSAGTDLAGQVFLPGVRTASSSLLLSSGSVTLDAAGQPQRGVHLPDRQHADHGLEHERPSS